jgi:hypothetical protein
MGTCCNCARKFFCFSCRSFNKYAFRHCSKPHIKKTSHLSWTHHRVILNELALPYLGKFLEELTTVEIDLNLEKFLFQTS